jgi:ankyrin repeat protein
LNATDDILDAITGGRVEELKIRAMQGYVPETDSAAVIASLMQAMTRGHEHMLEYFINIGIDVNRCDRYGHTILSRAIGGKSLSMVTLLIRSGADVNRVMHVNLSLIKEERGIGGSQLQEILCNTHLIAAIDLQAINIVKALLDAGADISKEVAVMSGVSGQITHSSTPLHRAVNSGNIECVSCLLNHGADKFIETREAGDFTPLMSAASDGHLAIAKLLVQNGANIHATMSTGHTARDCARRGGHQHVADYLRALGVKKRWIL